MPSRIRAAATRRPVSFVVATILTGLLTGLGASYGPITALILCAATIVVAYFAGAIAVEHERANREREQAAFDAGAAHAAPAILPQTADEAPAPTP